ncbi:MAG: exodeoxyribonuclease VII large subunit [Gammaproteobacteria bacterium]|nr:exodeoxyribonuclease VII large subunit [Gammaproteobacteria bacterium]
MQDSKSTALSVSELNRSAKKLLESGIGRLWVEGEISNLARPASGHVYFSLKDDRAQLRCAWFRQRQRGPTLQLKNGDQVLAFGQVSIYEARGDYQLIVETIEPAGEGELRRRFEALKKKLQAEGLFAEERKRELPLLPRRIGVVTSPSGAALRDILTVLRRRFPAIPVIVYPSAVQGEAAARELCLALDAANRRDECDVLIVGRGGGSLEDLWPFNEEIVARAIAASHIPVVSAVGHEVDFTIADFVADLRAPTPSGAAELVAPDRAAWLRHLSALLARCVRMGRHYVDDQSQTLDWLQRRLMRASPAATVTRQSAWLRNLGQVLEGVIRHDLTLRQQLLERRHARLLQASPALHIQQSLNRLGVARQKLRACGVAQLAQRKARLELAARTLHSVSPLATLERGYAIVTELPSGKLLTSAADVQPGTSIAARLAQGEIRATVDESNTGND